LHGALSQGLRNRRLMALRNGQVQILVATDVAARGIDVPTITHVFNFGLPMKAEDYTHRIGRTGRAGRDGIAVTFAEVRDRRKIMDIEVSTAASTSSRNHSRHWSHKQRFPDSRPNTSFGGGGRDSRGAQDHHAPRGGNFGGGGRSGGFGANRGGFADRNASGPRIAGAGSYQNNSGGGFGQPEGRSYERKGGFNDRFAGARHDAPAPRGDFGPRFDASAPRGDFGARKPAFGKPMGVKPGNGGKVFVPRDAQKRPAKPAR
jgi:superfamily II DNA/RNA helicase